MTRYSVALPVVPPIDFAAINEWLVEKNKGELLVCLEKASSIPGSSSSNVIGVQNWPRAGGSLPTELNDEHGKEGNLVVWGFEDKRTASAFMKKWGGDWF